MNRRSFLKLLGAAIAAPFVTNQNAMPVTDGYIDNEDGWDPQWRTYKEYADFDDDYEDDYEEKWPTPNDGPSITMTVKLKGEYSLDDGKTWHDLMT